MRPEKNPAEEVYLSCRTNMDPFKNLIYFSHNNNIKESWRTERPDFFKLKRFIPEQKYVLYAFQFHKGSDLADQFMIGQS